MNSQTSQNVCYTLSCPYMRAVCLMGYESGYQQCLNTNQGM